MWLLNEKENLHFDPYNLCISSMILKLESTICTIHRSCKLDDTIPDVIHWSKLPVELKVPTLRRLILNGYKTKHFCSPKKCEHM